LMIELVGAVHGTARGRLRTIAPIYATQNHLPIRAKLPNMRLMQFPQALETVLRTLERMRDEGAHRPRASRSALDALKQIAPRKIDILERHATSCLKKDSGVDNGAPSKTEKAEKLAA